MSAGNNFYSYNIIPATINHNNVYTITDDLYICELKLISKSFFF